ANISAPAWARASPRRKPASARMPTLTENPRPVAAGAAAPRTAPAARRRRSAAAVESRSVVGHVRVAIGSQPVLQVAELLLRASDDLLGLAFGLRVVAPERAADAILDLAFDLLRLALQLVVVHPSCSCGGWTRTRLAPPRGTSNRHAYRPA